MKSCCLVLIAGNRAYSIEDRTDPSPDNLAKPRTALKCSAYQLEQLVGEQGDDPKHQMKLDFRSAPHHDVACPETFFQAAVEPLRDGAFPVARRLMRGQGDNVLPPGASINDGDVPQAAADLIDGSGVKGRIHQIIPVIHQ